MRIVAGSARGMRLRGPGTLRVRPMAARVRKSLFDTLAGEVPERNVLDAFAGCGAVGLEALSRGARRCVFVEQDPHCCTLIEENLEHTRLTDRAQVIRGDVFHSADRLRTLGMRFGLLFFCPPYRLLGSAGGWERLLEFLTSLADQGLTEREAIGVVEHRTADAPRPWPERVAVVDSRKYGATALAFLRVVPTSTRSA